MIEACVPVLRRYARALLRNRQDQDDLVHDCLVQALDRLHTLRDDVNLRAWLFIIMHNLFISQQRRAKARGHVTTLDEIADVQAYSMPAGQERQTEASELLRALNALPKEQRHVLVLVTVENLSYTEVAQTLGIPVGTVMSRLARGRERLRRVVGD